MFMREFLLLVLVLCAGGAALAADAVQAPKLGTPQLGTPQLGTPMTAEELVKWDLTIFPDGRGLPQGRGTAVEGKAIFESQCASCHGEGGRGATAEELVGEPKPPHKDNMSKTIGSYWPYATTLFDFTRRSMPPMAPGSLSADQLYAVTAYLLHANGIIGEKDELTAASLAKIKMPNRDGFVKVDGE